MDRTPEQGATAGAGAVVRAFTLYTLLRLGLFVGSLGVLLAAGVRGLIALLGALLISSISSVYVLRRQREAFSAELVARRDRKEQERARLRALLDEPTGPDDPR